MSERVLVAADDDLAAWAASAPAMDGLLTPYGFFDLDALSDAGRIDTLIALERQRAWVGAQQARVFASMEAAAEAAGDDKRWVRDEVGCALRWSPVLVEERLYTARMLAQRLPATLDLLESGAISRQHVRYLVDGVEGLDDAVASKVEARVLERAPEQTPAAFRRSVRRAVASVDPRREEEQHAVQMEQRRVCVTPQPYGMAEVWALLPADGAATLLTALTAMLP